MVIELDTTDKWWLVDAIIFLSLSYSMNWEYLLTREYQGTPEDLEHCFAGQLVKKMGTNEPVKILVLIGQYIYI